MSAFPKNAKKLRARMLAHARSSGLSDATIKAAGLRPLDAATTRRRVRIRAAAYEVPYFDQQGARTDFYRVRLLDHIEDADGKELRYLQPKNTDNQPYFPPTFQNKGRVYLCEGERKALLLWQEGYRVIGLGGVWNWRTRSKGPLLPELRALAGSGAEFVIAFDGNVRTNKDVRLARKRLAEALTAAGGVVHAVELPDDSNLDDWYLENGKAAFDALPRKPHVSPSVVDTLRFPELDTAALRDTPPARRYVVTPWIGSGLLTFLAGTGGLGKTMLMLDLAVHVAAGARTWFGMKVQQGRVVLLALEDPLEELMRRLHYIFDNYCARHKHSVADRKTLRAKLADQLRIESLEGKVLRLLEERDRNIERTDELPALAAKLKPLEPSLIIIDPLSQLHTLNENDNSVGSALVSALGYIRTETGAAVVVPVHTNKESDKYKGRGRDSMAGVRGASSIVFGGRSVVYLSVLEAQEAARLFAVEAADAHNKFARFSHVKQNYGALYDPIYAVRGDHGIWRLHDPEEVPFRERPDGSGWLEGLRIWVSRRQHPYFSKRDVTVTHRAQIFGAATGRPKAVSLFMRGVEDGALRLLTVKELKTLPSDQLRGGGEKYTLEAVK